MQAMARVGVPGLDPDQPASTLQAGERQSLAIARARHFGARALVVDEPTAPLTVGQQTLLLQAIVAARSQGLAVLLVTNNPRYAHLVGDRFLLLAHGQVAGTLTREDVDAADLMRLMAGGEEFSALTVGADRAAFGTRGPLSPPGGVAARARRTRPGRRSGEDAHPAGADEQTDDDEHDPPQHLPPEDREDARDHQDDGKDPQQSDHDGTSNLRGRPDGAMHDC